MKFAKNCYRILRKCFALLKFMLSRPDRHAVTIFLYHDIGDTPSEFDEKYGLNVSLKTFQKQIGWIRSNFNLIHPDELLTGKPLPEKAAIISFDDGFVGAFENAINYLGSENIPSLMFLNMSCINSGKPILSAIACYLTEYSREFEIFAREKGLKKPYHLTLSPYYYQLFLKEHGEVDLSEVIRFQGRIADRKLLGLYNNRAVVVYGNHLAEHWNAEALTNEEFEEQFQQNAKLLSSLDNHINMFAFPNGHPDTCFTKRHLDILSRLGSDKIFYSSGGTNENNNTLILNRIVLSEEDNSKNKLLFKMVQAGVIMKEMASKKFLT